MKRVVILTSFLLGSLLVAQAPPPAPPAPPEGPAAPISGDHRVENRKEPFKAGSKLWVKNRNGSIRVTGWDRDEVAVVADMKDTERRRIQLVIQRKGEDLDVEAVFQSSSWSLFNFGSVMSPRCEMTLQVPRKLMAHFRTTNGAVSASNLDGYVRCETTNGAIDVKAIAGEVRAETTNGAIEARDLRARIKGSTTNGGIHLENVEGGIEASTTNGGIRAKNLEGWGEGITLSTTNGNIDVDLGKAGGDVKADNSNGRLEFQVPGAQDIDLRKHSLKARIPGRAQSIRLSTTNGGIVIRR